MSDGKIGRPSDYTKDIADLICERLADGESLKSICTDGDMPSRGTVFRWLAKDKTFQDIYARAREEQAETIFDEMKDISDDSTNDYMTKECGGIGLNPESIQRSKLRIDSRKWILAKLKPRKYGDKQEIHHSGELKVNKTTEELEEELKALGVTLPKSTLDDVEVEE